MRHAAAALVALHVFTVWAAAGWLAGLLTLGVWLFILSGIAEGQL